VLSGAPEPAVAHRLQGVRAELIGREQQMAILADAVNRLKGGQGAIISIAGNAGTGKSRLSRDFKATLNLKAIQWHEGHAYPYTQNTPYYPLINLLTHAFQIEEGDTAETMRAKVAGGIKTRFQAFSEETTECSVRNVMPNVLRVSVIAAIAAPFATAAKSTPPPAVASASRSRCSLPIFPATPQ